MYLGYSNIQRLKPNEVAGAQTINPIANFINGIRTTTGDYLELNPNKHDSIDIDLNVAAILALLDGGDELLHDFKCQLVDGSKISCSGGSVFFPDYAVTISAKSAVNCHSGYYMYARLAKSGGSVTGELVYDNAITHTLQPAASGNPDRVTLPICRTYQDSGAWKIHYFHIGAFSFANTPYFWLASYDATKAQALIHTASNSPSWTDLSTCTQGA